tara:strand:- start:53 stop:916 length:864 start_codon:yes stop_codon:yes gene_type:complete
MAFKRYINPKLLTELQTEKLYKNKLYSDCKSQKVFLAIRNENIDFYYKGGRLFEFDKQRFHTHLKYASVIPKKGKDYLTEEELSKPDAKYKLTSDFINSYPRIKENCANYSGVEARGVSYLYHKHSYLEKCNNVVVLDIEISFESLNINKKKKQDRIDILLLNKKSQELQFVEAKHYSNKEIWSTKTPKVMSQIERYEEQIKNRKTEIISEYTEYIKVLNHLFNISLPIPKIIAEKVPLLIFGFDRDQQNGRLKDLITLNKKYSKIKFYTKGNIIKVEMQNLWNAIK